MTTDSPQDRGIRCLALDFDGVVLESAQLKLAAFHELFAGHARSAEIGEYLDRSAGLSRYVKFRHIYERFLALEYSDAVEKALDGKFSALVLEKVVAAPYVPGADRLLDECPVPMYVVSAMPAAELRTIVERRSLADRFKGLFGAPGRKADQLQAIVASESLRSSELLFIGDSDNDRQAAGAAGVRFAGRRNLEPFSPGPFPVFADLAEALPELRRLWSSSLPPALGPRGP